jgi:hypothetical protein
VKLWILQPVENLTDRNPWRSPYDKAFGFVVRARNEAEARMIASQDPGDEGPGAWKDPELSTCREIPSRGEAQMIMRDFAAG